MSKVTCPFCAGDFDGEMVEVSELWRERDEIAAALGPLWKLANEYVEAFRKDPKVRMILKKRVRLLGEVRALWERCEFEYEGKRYRTDQRLIRMAMTDVCNRDLINCKNHNYLKSCLVKTASRVSTEGMTAMEENTRHISHRGTEDAEKGEERIGLDEALRRRGIEADGLFETMPTVDEGARRSELKKQASELLKGR